MSVSISEIIAGATAHAVPLAGECAGYLVLAAADQAVAAPRRIGPEQVRLFDDGTVRVEGARAAAETDAEGDLRGLLDALLLRASSSTPALVRASRRAPGRGIAALVREIETALIPVNRSAAHRALARLERETERARQSGRLDLSSPPEIRSREPEPKALVLAQPVTPAVPVGAPSPGPRSEPQASPAEALLDDIPSLFAPPVASVETIAALAAEIETRPEPVVARRSAPPPARTPSPPPLPVAGRRVSPPPMPVAEAQPTTPVFGTIVQSYADDEMDIEVVFDDELIDDELRDEELTGVLVRSVPLEISAMLEAMASPDTEPSPPVLENELSEPAVSVAPPPVAIPDLETTSLLAEAAEMPPEAIPSDAIAAVAPGEPIEVEAPSLPVETEAPGEVIEAETFEPHGETLALALAIEPVIPDLVPAPRLAMPKPRPSDVEDLLERMTKTNVEGSDDLRSSLKGLAGLEPTPPPPET